MVSPMLSKAVQLAAARLGPALAPAAGQAAAGAASAVGGAARQAIAGLAPRSAGAARAAATVAPRAAWTGALKQTGLDFAESAAGDAFTQATGIRGPTSPTLGGLAYDTAKAMFAARGAANASPPQPHTPPAPPAPPAFAPVRARPPFDAGQGAGSLALQEFLKQSKGGV